MLSASVVPWRHRADTADGERVAQPTSCALEIFLPPLASIFRMMFAAIGSSAAAVARAQSSAHIVASAFRHVESKRARSSRFKSRSLSVSKRENKRETFSAMVDADPRMTPARSSRASMVPGEQCGGIVGKELHYERCAHSVISVHEEEGGVGGGSGGGGVAR